MTATVKPPPWTEEAQAQVHRSLEAALDIISQQIDWGEHEGRKRKPCPEQPLLLLGMPIGQYHCPVCVEMQLAGMPHLPPDEDYERMTGHAWPAGYET